MNRARYTLVADISEFYGSIYTHSIEWALHTKAAAKSNLAAKKPALLGGVLDRNVRTGQDGQTMGLPIGPDTSLLLAEVILCAIDVELESKLPQTSKFCLRMMDDLEFSAQSQGEAEEVLLQWQSLLTGYSLSLNPAKTRIIEGPVSPVFPWQVQLAQFNLRNSSDTALANDIRSLFSLAFEFAKQNPIQAVLSYTVNRIRPRPTGVKSWRAFADLLLATVTTEPSSLRHVSSALRWAATRGLPIDSSSVGDTMNRMCLYHAPLEHGSEVAWSLSIMRDLDLPLSSECATQIATMRDNCSLLLLMEFIARKRISGTVPDITGIVSRAESPSAWKSEDWLLGYECARNGWVTDKNFNSEKHWAELLKLGIAFFATASASSPSVPPVPPSVPAPSVPAPSVPAPATPIPAPPPIASLIWPDDEDVDEEAAEDEDEWENVTYE